MADDVKPGTLESVEAEVAEAASNGAANEVPVAGPTAAEQALSAPVTTAEPGPEPEPPAAAAGAEAAGLGGMMAGAKGAAGAISSDLNGMSQAELEQLRATEVAFSWQAAEYVQHHKGLKWYAGLGVGVIVLLGLALLIKDWVAIALFLAAAGAAAVYAHKPPRTLLYELTSEGITIDGKQYPYRNFRSFGVLADTAWHTIDFEFNRQFAPHVSVLFDDDDFEQIVGHLELHLPRIDRKPDLIERIIRYVRF